MTKEAIKQEIISGINEYCSSMGNQYYAGQRELMYGYVSHDGWECRTVDIDELSEKIADQLYDKFLQSPNN